MHAIRLSLLFLSLAVLSHPATSQATPSQSAVPAAFPLAGDWEGVLISQGTVYHLVLHLNTTPEGKMTGLLDFVDQKIYGDPAIGGSFDGTRIILRFFYWKPDSNGDLRYQVGSYEATVNPSGAFMNGLWTQESSSPLGFKRVTWQAKIPKPAPPTIFDGDWEGIEYESRGLTIHFLFHLHNTEDGLMALLDCPEERFKGALASKVTYNQSTREIAITLGQSLFTGQITPDGKALDTSMTEPGFHFLIHFDRRPPGGAPRIP